MTIDAITPGARVLCAVSGGVDSIYLLYRMTELAAQRGFTVGCAHFNHGLRGAQGDADEAFVRNWCAGHSVPFYAGRGDVASAAKEHGWSIEEAINCQISSSKQTDTHEINPFFIVLLK